LLSIFTALLLPGSVIACLWDYDTLQMERTRFPSVLELITGKFLRHTPEFYEWRIKDRLGKLTEDPDNPALYDDLAVAYEKLGQHDKAIETILAKDKKKPGLYETEANLGTFLIHSGRLEEGLKHIDKALTINPDAHFGREKYQKQLVEYVISRRVDSALPLPLGDPSGNRWHGSFSVHLAGEIPGRVFRLNESDRKAAVNGVLGMMRFGNFDSPVLLEALGDLLKHDLGLEPEIDEKQLAARAYPKASYSVPEGKARQSYREKARAVLCMQAKHRNAVDDDDEMSLEDVESTFKKELSQADEWFASVRENELSWIQANKNLDEEFTKLYYEEPRVASDTTEEFPESPEFSRRMLRLKIALGLIAAGMAALLALAVNRIVRRFRRRQSRMSEHQQSQPAGS
jgi:tetratricopeptide (TPR) repeat protein